MSARRQGIAKSLMMAAQQYGEEAKAKGIQLSAALDNLNAQALYQSIGYKKNLNFYHLFFQSK